MTDTDKSAEKVFQCLKEANVIANFKYEDGEWYITLIKPVEHIVINLNIAPENKPVDQTFNCPPICAMCGHLHHHNEPCFVPKPLDNQINLTFLETPTTIIQDAHKEYLETLPQHPPNGGIIVPDWTCPHCGSDKGTWFSRTMPMANVCENCGKAVD